MYDCRQFYINGEWVNPLSANNFPITNPVDNTEIGTLSLGTAADVNLAVTAAKNTFNSYSKSSQEDRLAILERLADVYEQRFEEMAKAISQEMGAPITLSREAQANAGKVHLQQMITVLKEYKFEEQVGSTRIIREPIGVCGLITPWNWPLNQIMCKVAPALAAGCTMIMKPSEIAPISGHLFAEMIHAAGVPAGVFNLVHGDGPSVGSALSAHPDIDMMSFTGSTTAGIAVAKMAADTVKRVSQELGGKSANILLDDADFNRAVKTGTRAVMLNSGQSCNAPTRMLVPIKRQEEVIAIARKVVESQIIGDTSNPDTTMGPLSSPMQYQKVQQLIKVGIKEGARLIMGGPGQPKGIKKGCFCRPTIFSNVTNGMTIAQEEIFGPVLAIIPYEDEQEAIAIANDSPYGLSGYVWTTNADRAMEIARGIRAGMIHINGAPNDPAAPFGGYKQSGNGREWGVHGLEDFLETKAVMSRP